MSNPNTQEVNNQSSAESERVEQTSETNVEQTSSRVINYIQNNPRRFIAYSAAASAALAVPVLSLAVGVYPTSADLFYLPLTGMTLGAIGGGLTTGAVAGASAVNRATSNKEELLSQLGKKRPREDNNNEPESKKQKTETVKINNEEDILENNNNVEENNNSNVNGTDRDAYQANQQTLTQKIESFDRRLREKQCVGVKNELEKIFKYVPDAAFSDAGDLLEAGQPLRNKVQCLQWTYKTLNNIINNPEKCTKADKNSIFGKAKRKIRKESATSKINGLR